MTAMATEAGADAAWQPRTSARRRRIGRATTVARLCVTVAALVYILHKSGFSRIVHSLAVASPAWLACGFGVGVASAGFTVLQWHGLLRASGMARRYRRCVHLELAGDVFDAALPSAIGGDVIRAIYVSDTPDERVPGAASVILRRLCNFPGMVVIMGAALLACERDAFVGHIRPYSVAALCGGMALIVGAASPLFGWMAGRGLLQHGPGRKIAGLLDALHAFRGRRRDLLVACLRGGVFWCVVVASQWSFMHAVGIHVGFVYAAVVVTTTNAITMLPISLGGYGLRESAFATFLAVGHFATDAQGVAVGVCLTAQTMGLGLVGIPFYLTVRRGRRTARRLAPAARATAPLRAGAN
jgi:uncharacterized membrane protein YbhN (UPF0104 family)